LKHIRNVFGSQSKLDSGYRMGCFTGEYPIAVAGGTQ
jgi:hypothetical protein